MDRQSLSETIELLRPHGVGVSIASNRMIFSEGDTATDAYVIIEGVARLCTTTAQRGRMVSDFMFAGEPLGVIQQGSYMWTAESATDLDLLRIPTAKISELLNPGGGENGLVSYSWQLAADAWRFQKVMTGMSPDQRLAYFIVRLSQRTNTPIGEPIGLPMTHDDIACHLGLGPDDISDSFSRLTRQQTIKMNGSVCTILDASAVIGLAVRGMPKKAAPAERAGSASHNGV